MKILNEFTLKVKNDKSIDKNSMNRFKSLFEGMLEKHEQQLLHQQKLQQQLHDNINALKNSYFKNSELQKLKKDKKQYFTHSDRYFYGQQITEKNNEINNLKEILKQSETIIYA